MRVLFFLSVIFSAPFAHASKLGRWWAGFCEKHLIAEDPYPYADLSDEELAAHILTYCAKPPSDQVTPILSDLIKEARYRPETKPLSTALYFCHNRLIF